MSKRSWLLCGLAVMAVSVSSCIFDPPEKGHCKDCDVPPPIKLEDQTQRWHVLNNIEYAYRNRTAGPNVYSGLLDENFIFYFAEGDVGGTIPVSWGRVEELQTTTDLLNSNSGTVNGPVCRSIRFDLQYDKDTMQWTPVTPENFPNETWYETIVTYNFTFEMEPDNTYIQPSAQVRFMVRNVGQGGTDRWMLVEFEDRGRAN